MAAWRIEAASSLGTRVPLDNSLAFCGHHYNDPRETHGEVRYHFHF